jgi:hypothetical protein
VIFYLYVPYTYAPVMEAIPTDADWVLTREEKRKKLLRDRPDLEVVRAFPAKEPLLLLRRKTAG